MLYPVLDGPVFYGSPTVLNPNQIASVTEVPPIEVTTLYINRTTKPICVTLRNGMRYVCPPKPGFGDSHLQVQMAYKVHVETKESLRQYLLGIDDDCSKELLALKEYFKNSGSNTFGFNYSGTLMVLEYQIPFSAIANAGGELYSHDADVMVSLLDQSLASPHPYSQEGRQQEMLRSATPKLNQSNFGLCMEIVDSTGTVPVKYLNFLDRIYRVTPMKDPSRKDGLYVITHQESISSTSETKPKIKYYGFDGLEFNKHGLYDSHADAKVRGDHTLAKKSELVELEHAHARFKLEVQREKSEAELRELRLKQEVADWERKSKRYSDELEQERARTEHLMTLERLRFKDDYETRSLQRKDTSELMKSLPAIVLGVGGAVVAFITVMKQVSSTK